MSGDPSLKLHPRPTVLEFEGPPNDPELSLPSTERERRRSARWAFRQLRWLFQESRTATSIGFHVARGGFREARAPSIEDREATHRLVRLDKGADDDERLNLEMETESWHRYRQMHLAMAENGAAAVVTTIDKLFRQFANRAKLCEQHLKGGPTVGERKTSLLELIHAGGNWARHRHEWQAKHYKWDDDHSNWSVRILSRCQVYHLDENVFTQIVDKMLWDTWVECEEALVTIGYSLVPFAFEAPYKPTAEDQGYWVSKFNQSRKRSQNKLI